ncbi:four helix bundle protein [Algoriphagus sp. H41]|uniref:Four helix bundle protein n=1 Tax=Algoriphagus oliviformis TaxID=2811231 RepID=A0ABS3C7C8_9BACT|nr:four helix bundle protein [Algoriphagus oliviformis]MBN7812471.1 four helix bundle protein [Algoriphagus oliviformis]
MKEQLKIRFKKFALSVISLCESLPKRNSTFTLSNQIIRSSTSMGANYRSALRGRSAAEFLAKLGIVEEESDETLYWLELISESSLAKPEVVEPLWKECNELLSIVVATINTTRRNQKASK